MTEADKLSDERIAEMRRGLDGTTKGPWSRVEDQPGETTVWAGDATLCVISWYRGTGGNSHRDAAHIARCDPDTIRSLLTELQELRAAAKEMAK